MTRPDRPCLVHEQFEDQVSRAPDAVALRWRDITLSYRDLNARANQLAHHLRGRGIGGNDLVGVYLDRTPDLMISLLGILKSGAAYIPVDPTYPAPRVAYMLEAVPCQTIITTRVLAGKLDSRENGLVRLDTDRKVLESYPTGNPGRTSAPEDLIYVIFTSGSTGLPKGAGVRHAGFVNLLAWYLETFEFGASDRVLILSSASFDLTQKNFYAPLLRGGQVHLADSEVYDPGAIAEQVERNGITALNCTPSAFYPILESGGGDQWSRLASLRHVFLGGEKISLERLRPWQVRGAAKATVVNTYGPTECTDICAFCSLDEGLMRKYDYVPMGRPIPNVHLAVMNGEGLPAASGEAGELWIGGAGVGLGYLNDAKLTAEKFVTNVPGAPDGERFYRTGDIVRELPDGNLEFLGRRDHQIKFRGFRVELPEIEKVLESHHGVREAVVIVRTEPGREERLIAYYTTAGGVLIDAARLREHAGARLPNYMVPARCIPLASMPLSPNGKINRAALPEPNAVRDEAIPSAAGFHGELEKSLGRVWRDVLGVANVGPDDNFFDLGGNSVSITRVHGNLRTQLGHDIGLIELFKYPTIRSLARRLSARGADPTASESTRDRARRQRSTYLRRAERSERPRQKH